METVTGYSPLVNSSYSPVTKQFGLFHDNKNSTLFKQMNNNWTLLRGAYTFDDTVVVEANREQFMLFLPSFVLLCTVLGVGVPGNDAVCCGSAFLFGRDTVRALPHVKFLQLLG